MAQKQGVLGTTLSAIFFGLSVSAILSLIFGTATGGKEFSLETLFENMTVDKPAALEIYWIILLSWAIAGLIAGVRAKDPTVGATGAFFAAFIAVVITALLFLTPNILDRLLANNLDIDFSPIIEPLPGFAVGAIGTIAVATLFGFASGRTTQEPTKSKPKKERRASWTKKSQWKCNKCGHDLPPGRMHCPNCGAGVIQ